MSAHTEQQLTTLISSLRANRLCKNERKAFNTVRATVSGQVNPVVAKNPALDLIECYYRVNSVATIVDKKKAALQCLKGTENCESVVNAYVNAD